MLNRSILISLVFCLASSMGLAQRIGAMQNNKAVPSTAQLRSSALYFFQTGQYAAAVHSYEQIKTGEITTEDSVRLAEAKFKNRD